MTHRCEDCEGFVTRSSEACANSAGRAAKSTRERWLVGLRESAERAVSTVDVHPLKRREARRQSSEHCRHADTESTAVVRSRPCSACCEPAFGCSPKRSCRAIQPCADTQDGCEAGGERARPGGQIGVGINHREPALALHIGSRSLRAQDGDIGSQRDDAFSTRLDTQTLVQLPREHIMGHIPAWKSDEDNGAAGVCTENSISVDDVMESP